MSEPLDDLIEKLAADGRRVRRLAPPMTRAMLWLGAVLLVSALSVWSIADLPLFMSRIEDAKLRLELAGTALTGIAAIVAAFHLSLPDRTTAWAWLPVPPLALWIASSGYSCWQHWIRFGPDGWSLGESADCFRMLLGVSLPLGAALLLVLACAPIEPDSRRDRRRSRRRRDRRGAAAVLPSVRRDLHGSRRPCGRGRAGDPGGEDVERLSRPARRSGVAGIDDDRKVLARKPGEA